MGEFPSKDRFFEQLNTKFQAGLGEAQSFEMEMVQAETTVSSSIQDGFSLTFRAPPDAPPQQDTFNLTHPTLGSMDIFLVPIRKDDDGLYFEAIFNRLLV